MYKYIWVYHRCCWRRRREKASRRSWGHSCGKLLRREAYRGPWRPEWFRPIAFCRVACSPDPPFFAAPITSIGGASETEWAARWVDSACGWGGTHSGFGFAQISDVNVREMGTEGGRESCSWIVLCLLKGRPTRYSTRFVVGQLMGWAGCSWARLKGHIFHGLFCPLVNWVLMFLSFYWASVV